MTAAPPGPTPGPAPPAPARDVLAVPLDFAARLGRVQDALEHAEVDALVVSAPANIRYLTGFTGSAGTVLVGGGRAVLTTDGRYRTQGAEQLAGAGVEGTVELVVGGVQAQRDAVAGLVGSLGGRRVGLEADHVTWAASRRWQADLGTVTVVPTSGVVEALRQVKDDGELARMAHAAAIADAALGEVVAMLGRGGREDEVALALDCAMRRLGAEDRAFETIVASGPNSAKPHARPTGRVIEAGDCVVVDFGATFDGYRSDMTRTFCVGGDPPDPMGRVFDVVAGAQAAGVAAVRAGIAAGDVDLACRDLIAAAGWGAAFEHGTGHGVGLDIHEAPGVGPGATAILTPGVVVTVEPGVYLSGTGGVRVEDTVVVTEDGCRPLTAFPKDIAA